MDLNMADSNYQYHNVFYKVCNRFYMYGECPKGSSCDYMHAQKEQVVLKEKPSSHIDYAFGQFRKVADSTINSEASISDDTPATSDNKVNRTPVCWFFNKGNCHKGKSCRFLHSNTMPEVDNTKENEANSASTSNKIDENLPSSSSASYTTIPSEEWVNAPEFIPKSSPKIKSYAEIVNPNGEIVNENVKLCPYAEADGICRYAEGECKYIHGDICDLCGCASLHPFNVEQRKNHTQECIKQHERDMELSFAVARSKEKTCGVCFEVILEKSLREQRFGILPNCNHCFCLTCIRKWRQARQFENKIIRACPECRVTSDFVCPSMYWVDTKEEKEKLIVDYKEALSKKDCKYFKQGRGKCPFGNKCFYLHALPDGTKTDVGPPPRQQRRQNFEGGIDVLQQIILWDFLDERDNRWLYSLAEDIEDLVAFFSDSEDSDWSDYDLAFDD